MRWNGKRTFEIGHKFWWWQLILARFTLLQNGLSSFQVGYTKLKRFLPKNQHTQRKFLNFENWVNGKVSKIGHHFRKWSDLKLMLSKNVTNKKCAPKLILFNDFFYKDSDVFWHRKWTLNVQVSWFVTPLCYLRITDIDK